jgi:hypothetical protein
MTDHREKADVLGSWLMVRANIEKAIEGLSDEDLGLRGGADGWSIRETVHHLVEANLVAAHMILAALAKNGYTYDWSWVYPNDAWMRALGYHAVPVRPALAFLGALCEHFAAVIAASPDGLARGVQLLDSPGARPYPRTIREVVLEQIQHAEDHLRTVAEIRSRHGR